MEKEYKQIAIIFILSFLIYITFVPPREITPIETTVGEAFIYKHENITKEEVIAVTNIDRVKNGLPPLVENDLLNKSASMKVKHMFKNKYFDHNSPDGITPFEFIIQTGYKYDLAGENIARGFILEESMEKAFMESPGHRENILRKKYTDIGVASMVGLFDGEEITFTVVHFGSK